MAAAAAGEEWIPFVKMEGLGNDYLYLDGIAGPLPDDLPGLAAEASDRHFGVGSDGIITIERGIEAPFRMRIFNADGSEGEMCGNGIRCLAKYVVDAGYAKADVFAVETGAGLIRPEVVERSPSGEVLSVRVDMGEPRFRRRDIPMAGDPDAEALEEEIRLPGAEPTNASSGGLSSSRSLRFSAVSMGNPHCVIFIDDVESIDLPVLGPWIEHHPMFPKRINAEFVQVLPDGELKLRVWERGSGITLACGTGACAALAAAVRTGRSPRKNRVHLPGGALAIEWLERDGRVYMTGPAREIARGRYRRRRAGR